MGIGNFWIPAVRIHSYDGSANTGSVNIAQANYNITGGLPTQVLKIYADPTQTLSEYPRYVGEKVYELKDHLSNVRVTVSDEKVITDVNSNNTIDASDSFEPVVLSYQDYYPFGEGLPSRKYTASEEYRYSYNGKEDDGENFGRQDYGMRINDKRIGKFLSVDPLTAKYPHLTLYQFASNNPLQNIDIDGLEGGATNGAPTVTDLYHVTGIQNGEEILKNGFNGSANGKYSSYTWFSATSGASGTGINFDESSKVELKVKGINTKNAFVITNSQMADFEQQAFKELASEYGEFKSLDEARANMTGRKFHQFMKKSTGIKYRILGEYMDKMKKASYYLESESGVSFAFRDDALKGKVQIMGIKGKNAGSIAKTLNGLKYAGKTLLVIGVATDVYEIATSQNITKTITRKTGGWIGAWAGAEAGASGGVFFAGWGAISGGIIGGIVGYLLGETTTGTIYETLESKGWVPQGNE